MDYGTVQPGGVSGGPEGGGGRPGGTQGWGQLAVPDACGTPSPGSYCLTIKIFCMKKTGMFIFTFLFGVAVSPVGSK